MLLLLFNFNKLGNSKTLKSKRFFKLILFYIYLNTNCLLLLCPVQMYVPSTSRELKRYNLKNTVNRHDFQNMFVFVFCLF